MNDRRGHFRGGLHALYAPLYDELCKALSTDWAPTCGLRTFDEQGLKFNQGRTEPGPIVTKAAPGLSLHQYGLASDWDYFPEGRYSPLTFEDPKWQEYLDACKKVGLNIISWEKPHNEMPLSCSVHELLKAYEAGGMDAVNELLLNEARTAPPITH